MFFNTENTRYLYKNILAQYLLLTENDFQYTPDRETPLYDAIGDGVNSLNNFLKDEQNVKVLVTIITDGEENSSVFYNAEDIRALTTGLKKYGWEFSYLGTNHDVKISANKINIPNHYEFENSRIGYSSISKAFRRTSMRHFKNKNEIDSIYEEKK